MSSYWQAFWVGVAYSRSTQTPTAFQIPPACSMNTIKHQMNKQNTLANGTFTVILTINGKKKRLLLSGQNRSAMSYGRSQRGHMEGAHAQATKRGAQKGHTEGAHT